LAELTPIEKIRVRQNGWRMIYFHHRDTEHTEVSQRILNEVFRIRLYEAKALKARPVTAMGETHGHEYQTHFRVLTEKTPIEEIRVRQNGWRMIYFHHRDTEHTEVSQRIFDPIFRFIIQSKSAEGASCNSHGRNPWSRISNTFPGFDRKNANRGNEGSPKRLEDDLFSPQRHRAHRGFTENS
jgi:hypothetical protein